MSRSGGRSRGVTLLTALFLAGSSFACRSPNAVVLGVSTSSPYVDAARLAVEDEMAAGPLARFDTVIVPQSENFASPAIEAARRLVQVDGLVAVVGHSNSAASLAAAPIYNAHQVVEIAPTASAAEYSDIGPFSFRLVPPDDRQGRFLAEQAGALLPRGGRLAVVYVDDEYGRGLRAAFLTDLDTLRLHVVADLPHIEAGFGDADAAYTTDALGAAQPDLIVWLARGGVLVRVITGLRKALPTVPIVGSDGLGGGSLAKGAPAAWGDIRYVAYVDLASTEALRAFVRRYRERFGRDPTGSAALTYDATRLVAAGIRAGARTGDDLRAFLASLGRSSPAYAGITGSITFDDHGDMDRTYILVRPARAAAP